MRTCVGCVVGQPVTTTVGEEKGKLFCRFPSLVLQFALLTIGHESGILSVSLVVVLPLMVLGVTITISGATMIVVFIYRRKKYVFYMLNEMHTKHAQKEPRAWYRVIYITLLSSQNFILIT